MNIKTSPGIHGHRGARGRLPENSLIGIQYAMEQGCHGIEVDICVTADDVLVVHHDPILSTDLVRKGDTWIDDSIRVRDCTLAELQQFDIGRIRPGSDYAKRFPDQRAIDKTTIPTLCEFIEKVVSYSDDIVLNIEMKSAPEESGCFPSVDHYCNLLANLINSPGLVERVFLQSFDWRLAVRMKTLIPNLFTGFLTDTQPDGSPKIPLSGQATMWTNFADLSDYRENIPNMIKAMGADVWSANHRDLTLSDIQQAHAEGLKVYAWTVNDTQDMARMIEWGADVITTDYPDRLRALMTMET